MFSSQNIIGLDYVCKVHLYINTFLVLGINRNSSSCFCKSKIKIETAAELQHKYGKEFNIVNNAYNESAVLLVNTSITVTKIRMLWFNKNLGNKLTGIDCLSLWEKVFYRNHCGNQKNSKRKQSKKKTY